MGELLNNAYAWRARVCSYLTGTDSQHDKQEHGTEEMHSSGNDSVPADSSSPTTPPAAPVPHWGGFFTHSGSPSMLCRLNTTNLITGNARQHLFGSVRRLSQSTGVSGGGSRTQKRKQKKRPDFSAQEKKNSRLLYWRNGDLPSCKKNRE